MDLVRYLLELSGLGQDRLQVRWVSATEGQQFAEYVTQLTERVRELGPLDRDKMALQLGAVTRAINSADLRWLLGMQRQITERENVYHEKLDLAGYEDVVKSAAKEEYYRGLIYAALKDGPQTVRQIAGVTGLPVYTISLRLNDLEKVSLVTIMGHEGHSPKFGLLAA